MEGFQQPFRHPVRFRQVGSGQDRGELVATETGHGVRRAHGGQRQAGRIAQQAVADQMAVMIVDAFEVVKIEQQQADRIAFSLGQAEGSFEHLVKHSLVVQAGQWIAGRHVAGAPEFPIGLHRMVREVKQQGGRADIRRCRTVRICGAEHSLDLLVDQHGNTDGLADRRQGCGR